MAGILDSGVSRRFGLAADNPRGAVTRPRLSFENQRDFWSEPGTLLAMLVMLAVLRALFAGTVDLRTDEAYHWTWSKESVLSFLDHPPMIAWFVWLGTSIFGDTPFGVRFADLLAISAMQVFLADIVRRHTTDFRPVAFVVLAPEAAVHYGQMMALVGPDVPLLMFLSALLWSLVRLDDTRDGRWWLAAGLFGGLALLSKYTAIMVVPAILAFALWPPRNRAFMGTPWPWLAAAIAIVVFLPVLIWNAQHDWLSFAFQLVRLTAVDGFSLRWTAHLIGYEFLLVGPLIVVVVPATAIVAWRGYRDRDAVAILVSTAAIAPFLFLLWRSTSLRITLTWTMPVWPAAFVATALQLEHLRRSGGRGAVRRWRASFISLGIGLALVVAANLHYIVGTRTLLSQLDPIGQEAGYGPVADEALATMKRIGASWIATTDYRTYAMLRWRLKDRVPVVQINERGRFIGFHVPDHQLDAPGLYIVSTDRLHDLDAWSVTTATLEPLPSVPRTWRGVLYDTLWMKKVTGWAPDYAPPADSPLNRLPNLAERSI